MWQHSCPGSAATSGTQWGKYCQNPQALTEVSSMPSGSHHPWGAAALEGQCLGSKTRCSAATTRCRPLSWRACSGSVDPCRPCSCWRSWEQVTGPDDECGSASGHVHSLTPPHIHGVGTVSPTGCGRESWAQGSACGVRILQRTHPGQTGATRWKRMHPRCQALPGETWTTTPRPLLPDPHRTGIRCPQPYGTSRLPGCSW
ncbi:hypothetical protein ARZXY2_1601 [Arthrobacter sp. ZXY-2]|nr:hypothetical protein ARZXY2_1601 [Arthrobacter sp. ZXY-2]